MEQDVIGKPWRVIISPRLANAGSKRTRRWRSTFPRTGRWAARRCRSVVRRTGELSVRLALGARPGALVRRSIGRGLRPVVAGLTIGVVAAWWVGQLMTSLLFGVTARDPLTFASVAVALLATATIACYLPARRVLRVDPSTALRIE